MKKFLTAIIFVASGVATSAQSAAPQQGATYAAEACRAGCAVFNTEGSNFYLGAAIKSFRVCTANGYSAVISVDGIEQNIPDTKFGMRGCVDVSGQTLRLVRGEVAVGILPN